MHSTDELIDSDGPLAVFDTGIGGLSLVKELLEKHPGERFHFFSDNEKFRYEDNEAATKRLLEVTRFLRKRGARTLKLGCNTMDAMTRSVLRPKKKPLQIEGPIEATVDAIRRHFQNSSILIWATRSTIASRIYQHELRDHPHKVIPVPCHGLGGLIENYPIHDARLKKRIDAILEEIVTQEPELREGENSTIVLGCTHFVLAKGIIMDAIGRKGLNWEVFDPVPEVVQQWYPTDSECKDVVGEKLTFFHTAPYNQDWWERCRSIIPDVSVVREQVTLSGMDEHLG